MAADRLRRRDLAVLDAEGPHTPLHNVTVEVFDPAPGGEQLTYQRLLEHIDDRIAFVPRYRQRVRVVPGWLANPVWVDDQDFDLSFHVRRSALPRPGDLDQLRELTARILSRPLDPDRPLWEVYFVEGLQEGRVAVLSKSHQVLVDGSSTVDLGQVLLDVDADPPPVLEQSWRPEPGPSAVGLMAEAVADNVRSPTHALSAARTRAASVSRSLARGAGIIGDGLGAPTGKRAASASAFRAEHSAQRRVVFVKTRLADYRTVREAHGGKVHDVILATLAGAIRTWLMTRAEPVAPGRQLRALVPMSVVDEDLDPTSLGSQVIGHLVGLPIGEASAVVRLHQVSYALQPHSETGRAVAADQIAGVAGFAPTTFHALGSRVATYEAHGGVNLVVTNVPGPQFPMYLAGAQMRETYPVPPLHRGFTIAVGVTSYDGHVYYGITADRGLIPDVDVLGGCVEEALEELLDSASASRPRAPRGRRRPGKPAKGGDKPARSPGGRGR